MIEIPKAIKDILSSFIKENDSKPIKLSTAMHLFSIMEDKLDNYIIFANSDILPFDIFVLPSEDIRRLLFNANVDKKCVSHDWLKYTYFAKVDGVEYYNKKCRFYSIMHPYIFDVKDTKEMYKYIYEDNR